MTGPLWVILAVTVINAVVMRAQALEVKRARRERDDLQAQLAEAGSVMATLHALATLDDFDEAEQ